MCAAGVLALAAGCSSAPPAETPRAAAEARPAPPAPSAGPREEATALFYKGKALALAGEPACAREELHEALETFRAAARPGDAGDLEFAGQLYDSVALYDRRAAGSERGEEDRPPAENPKDSLVAQPPAAAPEEIATAEAEVRETAGTAPQGAFDIPVVVNDRVLKAIAFYQFRTPQAFAGALQRSGRYMPLMRQVLKDAGLPQDLVYVAMIESAFKCTAHSRKAAHGYWQFIDGTARRYGLKKSREIDERSDVVKSTKAAAAYFRDLYEMFGDWHLAMAAYDTGEGRVLRALQATGAKDYWELCAGNALHREARDYVPFVMAAALISREPAKFGFDVVPDPPLAFDLAEVDRRVDLVQVAKATGATLDEIQTLNGELRLRSTPRGRYALRLPPGTATAFLEALPRLPAAAEAAERRVTVRKGDTLARIAKRYRVTVAELCDWNDLSFDTRPRRGTVLVLPPRGGGKRAPATVVATATPREAPKGEVRAIPTPAAAVTSAAQIGEVPQVPVPAAAAPLPKQVDIPAEGFAEGEPSPAVRSREARAASHRKVVYTVRPGDTLFRIAQQFGLTVEAIRKSNGMHKSAVLEAGRRLTLVVAATAR